jgi:hypothetical protein
MTATRSTGSPVLAVALLLCAYLAVSYWRAVALPFLNDDYVFLDKVRHASFVDLWKPQQLVFNWYRPWSREFHYWALLHVAGLGEPAYHLATFALWLAVIVLYFEFVRRAVRGAAVAGTATAGVAALALWGAPLMWIAGAQDLWMLFFGLCFLHALLRGWVGASYVALVLALLSKETAAVLPGVALAYLWLVERNPRGGALRRCAGYVGVVLVWAALHPTLSARFFGPLQHSLETAARPTLWATITRTILAQANLDAPLAPTSGWPGMLLVAGLGAAALIAIVLLTGRAQGATRAPAMPRDDARRAIAFGLLWALLGWGILLLPSIGWHAYYGSLGSLGFWLAMGVLLDRHRRVAVGAVAALALLCQLRAATPSWDWGTYWYQKRAGSLLGAIRDRLKALHPNFPAGSRLYFAEVPNNIGLLAGDGPAVRVWYRDPTLRARYLSAYVMRPAGDSLGGDYFFRFDPQAAVVEISAGPESALTAERLTPTWRHDQAALASLFIQAGNIEGAARSYAKLSAAYPDHPNDAIFAATAYDAIGDSAAARAWYRVATRALGDSAVRAVAPGLVREARALREAGRKAALSGVPGPPALTKENLP